jgi:hypothetical protein
VSLPVRAWSASRDETIMSRRPLPGKDCQACVAHGMAMQWRCRHETS